MTTAQRTAAWKNLDYDTEKLIRPVAEERDEVLQEITGTLPVDLTGTLYRNGPARWAADHAVHAFDGDGMVSQLIFNGSSVRFRNRYVRTPSYAAGEAGGELRGLGTQRPGGVSANALRLPGDRANTHAVVHAERLLALADWGRPWELDLDTLETLGPCDFDGSLSRFSFFSPHPKIDPRTGEMFNFGLAPSLELRLRAKFPAALRCYRIAPGGRMETLATVPLDHVHINHDFGITERYLVFVLAPLVVDEKRVLPALLGLKTFEWATQWREQAGTRIILIPRAGGKARIVECPAIPYVHLNNAFEDSGDVVAEIIRYDDYEAFTGFVRDVNRPDPPDFAGGRLARLRISPAGRVAVEGLCSAPGELPQHDWRLTGRSHRFGYYSGLTDEGPAIIKVDGDAGTHRAHVVANDQLPGEPIFIPRREDAAEDDGWLLALVALPEEERTALFVLDAADVEGEPKAIVRLPHYAFPGFHGSFTRRVAA